MSSFINRSSITLLALLGSCVALADTPENSSAAPAASPASATSSTPAQSPAASATAAPTTAAAKAAEDDAEAKRLLAQGYKPEMRGGTKVWCRRDQELGSRLAAHKTCGTPEELRMTVHENQDVVEQIQRVSSQPSGK
jgi:hypothetical protein